MSEEREPVRLQLQRAIRAEFTYEVYGQEAPPMGSQWRDGQGNVWTVRYRGQATIALRGPEVTEPVWNVTLEANHAAYRVEPGAALQRIWSRDDIRQARGEAQSYFGDAPGLERVGVDPTDSFLLIVVNEDMVLESIPTSFRGIPTLVRHENG